MPYVVYVLVLCLPYLLIESLLEDAVILSDPLFGVLSMKRGAWHLIGAQEFLILEKHVREIMYLAGMFTLELSYCLLKVILLLLSYHHWFYYLEY